MIKKMQLDGPILFPVKEDLPYLAKPLSEEEKLRAREVAAEWGLEDIEDSLPISFVGSGECMHGIECLLSTQAHG